MGLESLSKRKRPVPDGLWMKCTDCQNLIFKKVVEEKLNVCPECNFHFRLSARRRIDITLDPGTFVEYFADLEPVDPLDFNDIRTYKDRLKSEQEKTGLKDAAIVGTGKILGTDVVFGATDSAFIMGSMGSVVGEKICRAAEMAAHERLPLVIFSGSGGGARMQEGIFSLAQMSKTSAAVGRLHDSGGVFISILTNPTMGGVAASFASLGDIVIAEPKALVGFSGPRVIWNTLKIELPTGFQKSEFLLEHGLIDMIVNRSEMRDTLHLVLSYLAEEGGCAPAESQSKPHRKPSKTLFPKKLSRKRAKR